MKGVIPVTKYQFAVMAVLACFGIMFLGSNFSAIAHADPASAGEVVHFAGGAVTPGASVALPTDTVGPTGAPVHFEPYSANPLNMTASSEEGAQKLADAVQPDSDGVCHEGGFSLGSVAAVKAVKRIDRVKCPKVDTLLQGSPNGPGSIAELLPDTAVINFAQDSMQPGDTSTTMDLKNDGYASCLNQLSSIIECPAGMLVGHYCAAKGIVPGQCYSDFNGPIVTTASPDGSRVYVTGQTRNPVPVLIEVVANKIGQPSVKFSPEQDAQFEAALPQGNPGVPAVGVTPRDVLQPAIGAPVAPPAVGTIPAPMNDPGAQILAAVPQQLEDAVNEIFTAADHQAAPAVAPYAAPAAHGDDIVGSVQAAATQLFAGLPH